VLKQFGPSTLIAILCGGVLAVVVFLPVVAYRYRKAGRLRLIDMVMLVAVMVYAMSLWTYTLVPIPETSHYKCIKPNYHLFQFVSDIRKSWANGGHLIRNKVVLQVLFNFVFFMPLGAFIRWVGKRGVVVATMVGLLVTALIETTQGSAVWGIFPCPYRMFDVDDLFLNTTGALCGSILAWPVAVLLDSRAPRPLPTVVTFGRRVMGVVADLMVLAFVTAPSFVIWRAVELYVLGVPVEQISPRGDWFFGWVPALLVQTLAVLTGGRTVGEAIVGLQPVEPGNYKPLRRTAKLLGGIGGYVALSATTEWITGLPVAVFVVVSIVALLVNRDHRGLSGLVSGQAMAVQSSQDAAAPV
jgi:glycopeptide antibiotics resistance protein